jgi:tripartite ATP-independent transporter DctM subunit
MIEGLRSHRGVHFWLSLFGIAALVVAGLTLWTLLPAWEISLPMIGIISLVLFFLFFFTGMPIAFVMIMIAFISATHVAGAPTGFDILGSTFFTSTANFTWAVIALFVLMAYLCFVSELGSDVFESANKWIGHIPGGLSIGTIAASTAFAAIVGDPSTPAVAIGSVAIPEMRKFKYSDELATGAILAGSTIGAMIPPSLGFILYGLLAEVSIGDLFVAGIIPGLLLSGAFIILIYFRCRLNPKLGPPGEKWNWRERIISLKAGGPIAVLFVLVIGGIYLGVFTPSEGGGVGAFGAFLIALFMRRLTWQRFIKALTSTGRLVALGFMMIGGAMALSYFFALSRLPDALMDFVSGLPVPSIMVIITMLVFYLILGCVMDPIPLLLLTVPIFAPMATALGYDPIWLGVLVILTCNVGFITPPYAGAIFILKGAFPEIPIGTLYRGVIPFVLASVVVIAIVVAFPSLATWIPYLMK